MWGNSDGLESLLFRARAFGFVRSIVLTLSMRCAEAADLLSPVYTAMTQYYEFCIVINGKYWNFEIGFLPTSKFNWRIFKVYLTRFQLFWSLFNCLLVIFIPKPYSGSSLRSESEISTPIPDDPRSSQLNL